MTTLYYESGNELRHHDVKGMKWGRRRYQNSDGSLTAAGRSRYNGAMTKTGTTMAKSKAGQVGVAIGKKIQAKKTERNAKKGFAEDSYNENKGKLGKAYDKVTGAHKIDGDVRYANASKSEREARARKYETDKAAKKQSKQDAKEQKRVDKYNKYGLDANNSDDVGRVYAYGYKGAQRIKQRINNKGMSELKAENIELGQQVVSGVLLGSGGAMLTLAALGALNS